ncbi:hypothetical protein BGZ65_003834 [Modicella reniformis]|uniref:Uncharacterized protein n=1 Tax=Modicella reniformis TaxID=1440133 RepID=A0A9P6MBJ0_9FUNG|nr:hypothetical protein BGZ65_003834 [Modicella reniformis]
MADSTDVEALQARLVICRQQLDCNSVINTLMRKEHLQNEIVRIEQQLAKALGIRDDEDQYDEVPEAIKRESATNTPEFLYFPSINSPGVTHSPFSVHSPKVPQVKSETPPNSYTVDNYAGSSSTIAPTGNTVADSIRLALVDAGEGDWDIEDLLRQQALMENRLADLKRRREEEDEAYARSIQEEEYQVHQRPRIFPPPPSTMQAGMDRARQERMDAEMAKVFAECESSSSSFNLASSPTMTTFPSTDNLQATLSARPLFPIFEKRWNWEETTVGPSNASRATASGPTSTAPLSAAEQIMSMPDLSIPTGIRPLYSIPGFPGFPGFIPANTLASVGQLQNHATATAILASAAGSNQKQMIPVRQFVGGPTAQSTSQKQATVDLTKPVIDLTKQVHEIPSSDEEDATHGASSSSNPADLDDYPKIFNSYIAGARESMSHNTTYSYVGGYDDENDEDDENEDGYGFAYLYSHDNCVYNQAYSWGRRIERDYSRNMTQTQVDQELRDLLANVQASEEDILPQDRSGTPEGMASHVALLEHQKIGLTWLQKMEDGTNRGGILGDDMGLGKTIQTMALIVSRPCGPIDDPTIWDDRKIYYEPPPASALVKTKATLVVAPVALVYQWAEELRTKTQPGLLKIHVYHGSSRFSDPEVLRRYDVVITTTATLTNDAGNKDINPRKARQIGTLFKAHFHRVVVDEAHTIKNRHTKSSKACAQIAATYRWCLTGTPVQNHVDELYSLIRFLNIKPYCDWDEFRNRISTPMKKTKQYGPAMQRVQALLKAICLRRTKKCKVDGKPILDLPDRNVQKVSTPFSDDERDFYHALEQRTRDRFNAYVRAGTVMKNYSNILVLLLRLRQACCHPHLINDFEKLQDGDTPDDQKAHVNRLLNNLLEDIRRRLIERGLDAVECPICMDVGEESVILSGCGHIYCRACITAHLIRHDEEDRKCPECRRNAPIDDLISVADFNARYCPQKETEPEDLKGKGKAQEEEEDGGPDKLPKVLVPEAMEDWMSSSKINKLIEIVKSVMEKKEKVIVFSQFTSLLTLIEKPLNAENIRFLRYDGSMKLEDRNEAVRRLFDDPNYSIMLISLKCGSLGLNLTVANHVVIMDPWWNPALENQAIDRVHRIGQTKDVFVHRLCIPETVEDRILALQAQKQALADGALGEGEVPKLAKLGVCAIIVLGLSVVDLHDIMDGEIV